MNTLSRPSTAARASALALLLFAYFVVAAASFSGYFSKWAFRDGEGEFAITRMIDGTAERPFVYRQLPIQITKFVSAALPQALREQAETALSDGSPLRKRFAKAIHATDPAIVVEYHVLYALSFVTLFASLLLMRRLCIAFSGDRIAGTLAPVAFALLLPLLLTRGGFYYDISELLFLTAAALLAWQGRLVGLVVVAAVAALNKESFVLFMPTLYPLLRRTRSRRDALSGLAAAIAVSLAIYAAMRWIYADSPGGTALWQLGANIAHYLSPQAYLELEFNYGVITGQGLFVGNLLLAGIVAVRAWPSLGPALRQHVCIALAINVPLFLALAYRGELRNLSLLYVALLATLSVFLRDALVAYYQPSGPTIAPCRPPWPPATSARA